MDIIRIMFETISNWHPIAQFIVILVWVIGSSGGIGGMYFAYLKARQSAVNAIKLETLENAQAKIKAEAEQQRVQLEIMREQVIGNFRNQETWQTVVSTMSERRREGDSEIAQALRDNTKAVNSLASILEIQSAQLGNMVAAVGRMESEQSKTLNTISEHANRSHQDVDGLLDKMGRYRQLVEDTLQVIRDEMEGLRTNILDVLSRTHTQRTQDNRSFLDQLNTTISRIESKLDGILNPALTVVPILSQPDQDNSESITP